MSKIQLTIYRLEKICSRVEEIVVVKSVGPTVSESKRTRDRRN